MAQVYIPNPDHAVTTVNISRSQREILQRNSINTSSLVRQLTAEYISKRGLK